MPVTGHIAAPELRHTQNGKQFCRLSIGATHRTKNKQTDQWEDVGVPLWITATFWGDQAIDLANLPKGSKVTVEGVLTIEEYDSQGGPQRELKLWFPRFLGVIPKKGQGLGQAPTNGGYQQAPAAQASFQQPQSDPWATGEQPHFPISQGQPAVDQPPF